MKKIHLVLLTLICLFGFSFTVACGKQETTETQPLQIVTTIYPEYDWVMEILGENPNHATVRLLMDNGVDLHSFQPTAEDIVALSQCDLFLYVGGESDDWVEDALKTADNPHLRVVNLMESLHSSLLEEELTDGMQGEEEEEEEGEEEVEYDEHIWLSPKNAITAVKAINAQLKDLDPANREYYDAKTEAYLSKLDTLDKQYQEATTKAPVKTLLFGDRFPFRYLTEDYGLTYYAAFLGCSAETEASFETIVFLADKVDQCGLKTILTIEGSDQKIAKTIMDTAKSTDLQILTMNSLQSVTAEEIANGVSYLSLMEENLEVLKKALQ